MVALECCTMILKNGCDDAQNKYALEFEKSGILDEIEERQSHKNEQIYEKAFSIVSQYFTLEEEELPEENQGEEQEEPLKMII